MAFLGYNARSWMIWLGDAAWMYKPIYHLESFDVAFLGYNARPWMAELVTATGCISP